MLLAGAMVASQVDWLRQRHSDVKITFYHLSMLSAPTLDGVLARTHPDGWRSLFTNPPPHESGEQTLVVITGALILARLPALLYRLLVTPWTRVLYEVCAVLGHVSYMKSVLCLDTCPI